MAAKNFFISKPHVCFDDVVARVKYRLEILCASYPIKASDTSLFGIIPGVYVFYEKGKPLYVGRTGNMRQRIKQHHAPSSRHQDACWAYNMAKVAAHDKGICVRRSREILCNSPEFQPLFADAKFRIAKMDVRFVEVDDAREQALLEYCASLELNTPWNDHSNS